MTQLAPTPEYIRVCNYCDAPTEEVWSGDEGFTFCSDGCGCMEGEKDVYKLWCPNCEEYVDTECNCNNLTQ
jgi:hypothetical protein